MIDLSNHLEHKECGHYIYITIGVNECKGFLYVGQHKCRKKGNYDRSYFGSGTILTNIVKKYGRTYLHNNFRTTPIWWCKDQDDANYWERFFIDYYESLNIGSNLCEGGDGTCGHMLSEDAKQKISLKLKGRYSGCNNPNYGKGLFGNENPFFGKHHSEETKQKLSEMRKGKSSWNKGKHHSEETKQKLREAHKGVKASEETIEKLRKTSKVNRKGKYVAYKNGVVVGSFDFVEQIQEFLGRYNASVFGQVCRACRGEQEFAYGYTWKREQITNYCD